MAFSCLRSPAVVLTGIATIVAAGAVAAQRPLSFDEWWGRPGAARTTTDTTTSASARLTFGVRTSSAATAFRPANTLERLHHWNHVAIDSSGLDHSPVGVGAPHAFGHQLGPGRSSRALAIVHVALFEVVNAIDRRYQSYLGVPAIGSTASVDAAIAQAAHDTLVALFPSQKAQCDQLLAADLATMPDSTAKRNGVLLGRAVAAGILLKMRNDGSNHAEPLYGVDYIAGNGPGVWRQDPISRLPPALGARWGTVRPFVVPSGRDFRAPPPPPLWSTAYAAAYNEVKRLGGDGITTPTVRTDDQTIAGIYWAYDGTPSLCAPPRLYNQIAEVIATQMGSDVAEQARLFALVNVAMADAGIAIWESKYFYKLWRPVTGIREADPGTGPTGIGDRNPLTRGDATFTPPRGAGQQPGRAELHAAVPGLSVRPCRLRRRALPDPAQGLRSRRHRVHVRLRRAERRDRRQRGRRAAAPAAQLPVAVARRGGERPEPHLPGHPLVVRQEGRHRAGSARGRLRVHPRVPAALRRDTGVGRPASPLEA